MTHKNGSILVVLAGLLFGGCADPITELPDPHYASNPSLVSADEPRSGTSSAPSLGQNPTLEDYLEYAAINNPGLEAAFNRWKAAAERVGQVRALPDPKFTYRYYIQEVETRVGPQRQALGISQMFPWFGKLELRGDAAAQAATAEQMRYEAAKLRLFYDVRRAYYECYYQGQAIEIVRQDMELVRMLTQVVLTRYSVSSAGHPDIIKAQVELGKAQNRLRTFEDLHGPVIARFNAVLGRAVGEELRLPASVEKREMNIGDADLEAMLLAKNPELIAIAAEVMRSRTEIDMARKEGFPEFTLGIDAIQTDRAEMGDPRDNGKDPVMASLTLSLPVWREKVDAGVSEARHRYSAAMAMKNDKANMLMADLRLASYGYRDAKRREELYTGTLLPKARESLDATMKAYQTGRSSFSDLIDAQRVLLEFELACERAKADRAQRLAEVEMLVGGEL